MSKVWFFRSLGQIGLISNRNESRLALKIENVSQGELKMNNAELSAIRQTT